MEQKSLWARWQSGFLTGLAVILPTVITFAVVKWLFGTIASFTNFLLFFLPTDVTHDAQGQIHWYWSAVALLVAVLIITVIGSVARHYIGKKLIEFAETVMLRIPLFNKIYGAIKQVNDAFAGGKNSFKTVVLIEFPSAGMYSIGFITSDQPAEMPTAAHEKLVSVFVPTTPNPTAGFLILLPAEKVTKLEMSVAQGVKYIVSLGSISPESAKRMELTGK